MSKTTGVHQRHTKKCKRRQRCSCPLAFHLELSASIDGKRRQITKSGYRSAKEAARARREAQSQYTDPEVSIQFGRMTVAQWLDKWMELRTDPHSENPLRESTASNYQLHIDKTWKPTIGQVKIRDLTASQVEAVHRGMRRDGLSENTVHRVHATLRSAIRHAYRKGYIARNPLDRVTLGATTPPSLSWWTLSEWHEFAEHTSNHRLAPLFRLAADGGLRRGELLGLMWRDVDLETGTVTIVNNRVQIRAKVVLGAPKTKSGTGRTIYLSPGTVTVLRRWKVNQAAERLAAGEAWTDSGLVFTNPLGRWLLPQSVSQAFRRACDVAGVRRIRFHDLRHLSADIGALSGESDLEVSKRLGHSDPAFTKRVYRKVWESQAAESATSRGSVLDGNGTSG